MLQASEESLRLAAFFDVRKDNHENDCNHRGK